MHHIRLTRRTALQASAGLFLGALTTRSAFAHTADEASPVAAATPQLPATVTDVDGNEVTVEDVSRIVALNGNIAEILFALGLGANVVATDVTAFYPEEALALPKIGYARTLAAEGILSFEPTLVIGNLEAGPPEVIQQIRDSGVTVVMLPYPESPDQAGEQVQQVADAVGVSEAGAEIAANINDQLAKATELAATSEIEPRVAFMIVRGQGVQLVGGANSSADGVITAAGGINVAAEVGLEGFAPITPEALIEAAPDVLVVLQDGLASAGGVEGLLQIPGLSQTPAGEDGNIVAFNDLYILGFGPRMGDAIYDLTIAIHPDLDEEPLHPEWQGTDVDPVEPAEASPTA